MTLGAVIDRYVAWKRSCGLRFEAAANVLRHFARVIGRQTAIDRVSDDQARTFLAGSGPLTPTRSVKRSVLDGFYRYALGRGFATRSPLPADEPRRPPSAAPYIYARDEVRRLLDIASAPRKRVRQLEPPTFRALLLLLYGAGLRLGEALRLQQADIDLTNRLLTVRDSKFHKGRLLPLDPRLAREMAAHAARSVPPGAAGTAARPFFANRDGTPLRPTTVRGRFAAVREEAGIRRSSASGCRPRLHDLRHVFAVHRLTAWYRQGADVQRLLPMLSVYMGHASLASTQVYLTVTPELLRAASLRFQRYAGPEGGRDA